MTHSPAPEEAIRECPFCGNKPHAEADHWHSTAWEISCDSCDINGISARVWAESKAAAIAAWNRRVGGEREAWQPIESAPRDGSEIILGALGWSESGFWHDGSENYWKVAGWYAEMDRGNLLTAKPDNPTHWQPLPAPPRAALSGQTEGRDV